MTSRETGKRGERLALQYLRDQGYEILDTNWYCSHYEIDIVSREGDELVIVEVKSRTGDRYENPEEAVDRKKIRRLISATQAYIYKKNINLDTRFDIISITFLKDRYKLEHIKDAFNPTLI